jgi:hypothetical protein
LSATGDWQGATGSIAGGVTVTNVGQRECVLAGSPRLVQLRSGTTILAPVRYVTVPQAGPPGPTAIAFPVLLRPGERAGLFLTWVNWCARLIPIVTELLVTLPGGGLPMIATPALASHGFGSTPRCDAPAVESTLTGFAFAPLPPPEPSIEPQAASVTLSVPSTAKAGEDLVYLVALTNEGSAPAFLDPCPTYSQHLVVDNRAVKQSGVSLLLLNCPAIGNEIAPGASVLLEMHEPVPIDLGPGPVELDWFMDPGGPFDSLSADGHASLTIVAP